MSLEPDNNMKVELNIEKKYFFAILSSVIILAAVFGVYAYGTNTPSVFGHSAGELAITLSNGSVTSLQNAITNNYIGGGGGAGSTNVYNIGNISGNVFIKQVSFGIYSICLLFVDGKVACAGYQTGGQLGIGPGGTSADLFQLLPISGVKSLTTMGSYNHCAVMQDGSAKCWGYNPVGQVGVGTNNYGGYNGYSSIYYPTTVIDSGVVDISITVAAYYDHSCAVKTDGTVWCWGYNGYGQLGVGDTTQRTTPTQVSGLSSVSAITTASGSYVSPYCALKTDGTVWCWGYNGYGQLGVGDVTQRNSPTKVNYIGSSGGGSLPKATKIFIGSPGSTSGGDTVCALLEDQSLACWGYNGQGAVGDGTFTDKPNPVRVLTNVKDFVIAGWGTTGETTCAVKTDGTVWCWGYNGYHQIPTQKAGVEYYVNLNVPAQIIGLTNATSIYAGGWSASYNICAVLNDLSVRCWGYNGYGQLGVGHASTYSYPAKPIINF